MLILAIDTALEACAAAVLENPHLRAGLNVYRGRLTYKAVAESLGLPFSPIDQAAA